MITSAIIFGSLPVFALKIPFDSRNSELGGVFHSKGTCVAVKGILFQIFSPALA